MAGIESLHVQIECADMEAGGGHEQAAHVKERKEAEVDIPMGNREVIGKMHVRTKDVSVAQQSASGSAAYCCGVNDYKAVIGGDIFGIKGSVVLKQGMKWDEPLTFRGQREVFLYKGQVRPEGPGQVEVFLVHGEKTRFPVLKYEAHLFLGKAPVDRENDSTQSRCAADHEEILKAVLCENPHAVALFQPIVLQTGRYPLDLFSGFQISEAATGFELQPGRFATEGETVATDNVVESKVMESHLFLLEGQALEMSASNPPAWGRSVAKGFRWGWMRPGRSNPQPGRGASASSDVKQEIQRIPAFAVIERIGIESQALELRGVWKTKQDGHAPVLFRGISEWKISPAS
jgi:hypothetical protein